MADKDVTVEDMPDAARAARQRIDAFTSYVAGLIEGAFVSFMVPDDARLPLALETVIRTLSRGMTDEQRIALLREMADRLHDAADTQMLATAGRPAGPPS